jgi:hypothetical protein
MIGLPVGAVVHRAHPAAQEHPFAVARRAQVGKNAPPMSSRSALWCIGWTASHSGRHRCIARCQAHTPGS